MNTEMKGDERTCRLKSLLKNCTKDTIIEYLAAEKFLESPESIAFSIKNRQFEKDSQKLEKLISENLKNGDELLDKIKAAEAAGDKDEALKLKIKILENQKEHVSLYKRYNKLYDAWNSSIKRGFDR